MNDTASIGILLAATRCALLIICEWAAILCIYLGWKLYMKAVTSNTEGEFSGPGFKLKLASGGPGVFLCGLGIWLLLSITNRPFQATVTEQTPLSQKLEFDFYRTTSPQPAPQPGPHPAQKAPEKIPSCLIRTSSISMDTGKNRQLTAADVAETATTAAEAIRRAGEAGIPDAENRSKIIKSLINLAALADEKTNETVTKKPSARIND